MRPSYQPVRLWEALCPTPTSSQERPGYDASAKTKVLLCHAAYKYIGATFGASPSQLGSITLTRALVQALTSPVGGLLGDRMDRTYLVAFGCILWGAVTGGVGLSQTLTQVRPSALPPDVRRDSQQCLSRSFDRVKRSRHYICKHAAALEPSLMFSCSACLQAVMWNTLLITSKYAGNVPQRMEWIRPGADHTLC